jgi:hypothetical protein
VTTTAAEYAPRFVAFDDMPAYLTPDEVSAFNRIGFFWALPYRSIILADGGEPAHIVYDSVGFSSWLLPQGARNLEREEQNMKCRILPATISRHHPSIRDVTR